MTLTLVLSLQCDGSGDGVVGFGDDMDGNCDEYYGYCC